jgi:hypothetical protein
MSVYTEQSFKHVISGFLRDEDTFIIMTMEPLQCFEVRWTMNIEGVPNTSDNAHTIFSFSIPECLVDENVKMKLSSEFLSNQ